MRTMSYHSPRIECLLQRIGENEEEGKGGHIRAMLLSNRATTLLKVRRTRRPLSRRDSDSAGQLDRHEDALADADASIELNSLSFKVYRTRARINLHLEKYEAAVGDFKSAIEYAESEGNDGDVRALRTELKKAELDLKRSKTKDYYKILGMLPSHQVTSLSYTYANL